MCMQMKKHDPFLDILEISKYPDFIKNSDRIREDGVCYIPLRREDRRDCARNSIFLSFSCTTPPNKRIHVLMTSLLKTPTLP